MLVGQNYACVPDCIQSKTPVKKNKKKNNLNKV